MQIFFSSNETKGCCRGAYPFKEYINNNVLIISLLAGVSTDSIRKLLQKTFHYSCNAKYIRSHFKISYRYLPSKHATAEHIRTATSLFETIGLVSVVEEEDMHAVTALSGSGPAYIYYVVEAMEEAAKNWFKRRCCKITYSSNDDWCC